LRDARHLNFDDSLIRAIETSLCNGPVYFDGYPDLTISLTDKNILETLKINIKLHGYNMLPRSEIIAIDMGKNQVKSDATRVLMQTQTSVQDTRIDEVKAEETCWPVKQWYKEDSSSA
ncbi:MP domain-containing protein, partial [Cephalotus follicularis]